MEKTNVEVSIRMRPMNDREIKEGEQLMWRMSSNEIVVKSEELAEMKQKYPNVRLPTYGTAQSFQFNNCFGPSTTSKQIFDSVAENVIDEALEGYNGTIFAYGQTGSGKTFTMMGDNSDDFKKGKVDQSRMFSTQHSQLTVPLRRNDTCARSKSPVDSNRNTKKRFTAQSKKNIKNEREHSPIPRKVDNVTSTESNTDFQSTEQFNLEDYDGVMTLGMKVIQNKIINQSKRNYFLRCSFMEIYCEKVYDLLSDNREELQTPQDVYEDCKNKKFAVFNATEEDIHNLDDVFDIMKKGEANRHFASTKMNHASSRSHTLFRLYIKSIDDMKFEEEGASLLSLTHLESSSIMESIQNFVDLAGSERVSIHDEAQGKHKKELVKEAKNINTSLFWLNRIISQKSGGLKETHVPYRNSVLTKILKGHIGDNANTSVILCITPGVKDYEQTLSTLRFGAEAKLVRVKVKKNIIANNRESIKQIVEDYDKKIAKLCMVKDQAVVTDGDKACNILKSIIKIEQGKKTQTKKLDSMNKLEIVKNSILRFSNQNNQRLSLMKYQEGEEMLDDGLDWEENNVKRETKLAHCFHAGNLEHYEEVKDNINDFAPRNSLDKTDFADLLKNNMVESLKSNLEQKTQELEELKQSSKMLEDQNYNMANMLNKNQKNNDEIKKENELLHTELAEINDTNGIYDSLIRFFLNMRPDINAKLNNQLIEKLTSNNLLFLDNIKSQKSLNRFNYSISLNDNFEYEDKKTVCNQVSNHMAYEENLEGEIILNKLVKINEQDYKKSISIGPQIINEIKKNNLSTVESVITSKESYSRSSKGSMQDNEHVVHSTFIDTSNAQNNIFDNKYNNSVSTQRSMNADQNKFKKNPMPDMLINTDKKTVQSNYINDNTNITKTSSEHTFNYSENQYQMDPLSRPNRNNKRQVNSTMNFEPQESSSLKEGSIKSKQSGNLTSQSDFVELRSVNSVTDTTYGSQKDRKVSRK